MTVCPPPSALSLLSLAPSLRMDHVFILLMSPADLWVGFFYSLLVTATVESDMCKGAMALWNVTLKGKRSLWCFFPCLPFLKESETGWRLFFPFFPLRNPNEGMIVPRQYNEMFLVFKFRGGENLWAAGSDTESSKLCSLAGSEQALPSASLASHCLSVQKDVKYSIYE